MARGKKVAPKDLESALVPVAEQPYEVPGNWCWVRLGDAYEINPTYDLPQGKVAFMPMTLIPQGLASEPQYEMLESSKYAKGYKRFANGDVVFAKISPCFENRKSMIVEGLPSVVGAGTTELVVLRQPNIDLNYTYLLIIDERFIRDGAQFKGTVGQQRLRKGFVENYLMPLPPLAEQRRIVERIESLFAKLDEAEAKLQTVLEASEQRQSAILHAAFTGDESWEERALGDVCLSIYDGDHMPPPKAETGVPFLVISDVNTGHLRFDNARFVPQAYYDGLTTTRKPQLGDVLYTLVGSYGIPVLVDQEQPFCFQRHMALLKPDASQISSEFLRYLLLSPQAYDKATSIATGTAQLTVPIKGLRKLSFPIPSPAEQQTIVAKLDTILSCEQLVANRVRAARTTIDTLRQTILAKALHGELGTNDPADPSSLKLLEDILVSRGGST